MNTNTIIVISLVFIPALCKAIQDTLMFHFSTSIFKNLGSWWDPSKSWQNKYTWSTNKVVRWLLCNPLVGITDAWHLFNTIGRVSTFYWLIFITTWYYVLLIYSCYVIIFHVFFTYIFNKK